MAFKQLERIDRRILWFVSVLLMIIVLLVPLNLPVIISERAIHFYEVVAAVPNGSMVLVTGGIDQGNYRVPEAFPNFVAVMKQLIAKNCKFVFITIGSSAAQDFVTAGGVLDLSIRNHDIPLSDKVYGVDYVNLGYIAGLDPAMSAWAKDIIGTKPLDYVGTPLNTLQIMANIKTVADFDFWVIPTHLVADVDAFMRTISAVYRLPCVVCGATSHFDRYLVYVSSGLIQEVLCGANLAAQYEKILGLPGLGTVTVDCLSIIVITVIVFIALGNLPVIAAKFGKRAVPAKTLKE